MGTRKRLAAVAVVAAVAGACAASFKNNATDRAANASAASGQSPSITPEDIRQIAELPLVAARLRERLAKSPGDGDGWALLARTYVRLGEYPPARMAFQKAVELRGDDAEVLVDYADTLAYLNGRSFEGEPLHLIDRALRLDPAHPPALMLAGLAAFDRKDYRRAIAYWEKAVQAAGPDNPVTGQALRAIAEARRRAGSVPMT